MVSEICERTDRQTDLLVTIFRTRLGGEVNWVPAGRVLVRGPWSTAVDGRVVAGRKCRDAAVAAEADPHLPAPEVITPSQEHRSQARICYKHNAVEVREISDFKVYNDNIYASTPHGPRFCYTQIRIRQKRRLGPCATFLHIWDTNLSLFFLGVSPSLRLAFAL